MMSASLAESALGLVVSYSGSGSGSGASCAWALAAASGSLSASSSVETRGGSLGLCFPDSLPISERKAVVVVKLIGSRRYEPKAAGREVARNRLGCGV